MNAEEIVFYFDFVDPLSWVVEQSLERPEAVSVQRIVRFVALELRPPPEPLVDPDDSWWRDRQLRSVNLAEALGLTAPAEPGLIPWSRKAHELVAYAHASGVDAEVRRAVFEAFFVRGEDIGRVDVLVRIAGSLGLEATGTKAALDVDRYSAEVLEQRARALDAGVGEPPALAGGGTAFKAFPEGHALRTFLRP